MIKLICDVNELMVRKIKLTNSFGFFQDLSDNFPDETEFELPNGFNDRDYCKILFGDEKYKWEILDRYANKDILTRYHDYYDCNIPVENYFWKSICYGKTEYHVFKFDLEEHNFNKIVVKPEMEYSYEIRVIRIKLGNFKEVEKTKYFVENWCKLNDLDENHLLEEKIDFEFDLHNGKSHSDTVNFRRICYEYDIVLEKSEFSEYGESDIQFRFSLYDFFSVIKSFLKQTSDFSIKMNVMDRLNDNFPSFLEVSVATKYVE